MDATLYAVPNSNVEIQKRASSGKITLARPLAMVFARLVLFAAWQAVVATVFALQGSPDPWGASVAWWPLTVTLTNLVCLGLLDILARKEGLRLIDLYKVGRHNFGKELLFCLGTFVISAPLSMLPNTLIGNLLFGDVSLTTTMMFRPLPIAVVWVLMVALSITNGLAETPTYFAYCMPRLAAVTGRGWQALLICALMLAAQHIAFPLIFDLRFIVWRLLMFVPFALWIGFVLYKRPRLLPYIMVGHSLMDFSLIFMLLPAAF